MRRRKAIIRDIAALGQPRIGRPLETKANGHWTGALVIITMYLLVIFAKMVNR